MFNLFHPSSFSLIDSLRNFLSNGSFEKNFPNNNKKPIHPLEKIIIDNTEYKEQSLENNIYYN